MRPNQIKTRVKKALTGSIGEKVKTIDLVYKNWELMKTDAIRTHTFQTELGLLLNRTPISFVSPRVQVKIATVDPDNYGELLRLPSISTFEMEDSKYIRGLFEARVFHPSGKYLISNKALKTFIRNQRTFTKKGVVTYFQHLRKFEQSTGKKWRR